MRLKESERIGLHPKLISKKKRVARGMCPGKEKDMDSFIVRSGTRSFVFTGHSSRLAWVVAGEERQLLSSPLFLSPPSPAPSSP